MAPDSISINGKVPTVCFLCLSEACRRLPLEDQLVIQTAGLVFFIRKSQWDGLLGLYEGVTESSAEDHFQPICISINSSGGTKYQCGQISFHLLHAIPEYAGAKYIYILMNKIGRSK